MPDFDQQIDTIAQLRTAAQAEDDSLHAARLEVLRLRRLLARAREGDGRRQDAGGQGGESLSAIAARLAVQEATVQRLSDTAARARKVLGAAIGDLYREDPHPRLPLARLDDRTPFLLLPLRLETVFAAVPGGTELWVRVYPDDIAVHTHEATLTAEEVDAGQRYWTVQLAALHLRDERDSRQRAAWRELVDRFGGQRAAWVVRATRPSDWDTLAADGPTQDLTDFLRAADAAFFADLLAQPLPPSVRDALLAAQHDGDALVRLADAQGWTDRIAAAARSRIAGFPVFDVTRTDAWSRAPRTQVLPDRLVLLLYPTLDVAPREIVGAVIPDTVYLGPDPLDPDASLDSTGALAFTGDCRWLSDFDTAVAQGLGFRVKLGADEARQGFARVMVLGTRLSAGAAGGAQAVETLVANHQYGPRGFSLVPQGTATNNTAADPTGFNDNDAYDDVAFLTDLDPPAFDPAASSPLRSQTDGRRLADALGIGYAALQTVQRAGQTDGLEAAALNTALFPATLGYWLREWMAPVVTPATARLVRDFFTAHVSGRGPLPAIRVGNQPYGVLLASDLTRWKYPARPHDALAVLLPDAETPFLAALHGLLAKLAGHWTALTADLAWVGKPGSDTSEVLMNLLGLHPTSVSHVQRVGFGADFLGSLGSFMVRQDYANELASLLRSMPATVRLYFNNLGFPAEDPQVGRMLALHVLWQHYTTALDTPAFVDDKPPSETIGLAPDYIAWLASAEGATVLATQRFGSAEGGTERPTALLYAMLRNALLLQLHHGSYEWLKSRSDFDPVLQAALLPSAMPGVRPTTPAVSKFELMAVKVDAVEPIHPVPGTSVADWIWGGPRPAEIEAAYVQDQRAALGLLAGVPTARLARAFVEHLDCCQYRLDAWETGLFAQRLQQQRGGDAAGEGRAAGIYLGAYGWLEDLRPTPRRALAAGALPPSLRPDDDGPILEEDDAIEPGQAVRGSKQGGYLHAPSPSHAAAGALLRGAYLAHAGKAEAEMLSVNLSSERVRRAQFVLEGMRNGQPVEALLGYQFERGLHDLTSASAARGDVPVLELNEFILPYRQAFPFVSREIAQAGGTASETVPAYGVVNGLALGDAPLAPAAGYGLGAVLPPGQWPNPAQGAAILAQRDAVLDTLDAVKDLLMAENAFQLVQGNFDRVAGVSLAQKDARIPPSLEVLNTPRGTAFSFTQRVTLHFDDLDPAQPASNPWAACPMTPRATAEPGLNAWIATLFGVVPAQVHCSVSSGGTPAAPDDVRTVTAADLALQPVDLVALTTLDVADTGGATELETRIAWAYRRAAGVGLDTPVRIDFQPVVPAGTRTFGQCFAVARPLRGLLRECRPLDARDFLPAAGASANSAPATDPANPGGQDPAELRVRLQSTHAALTALADALIAPALTFTLRRDPDDPAVDEPFAGSAGAAFDKLDQAAADFADSTVVDLAFTTPADADTLHVTLRAISAFGIADAFPPEPDAATDPDRRALLSRARRVARRLRGGDKGVLDRAGQALVVVPEQSVTDQIATLRDASELLFGGTLQCLPVFACVNTGDLVAADADRAQLLAYVVAQSPGLDAQAVVDEWLEGLARVRPRLQRWETVRMLADALADTPVAMRPVQLPYRARDSWLATVFPATDPLDPTRPFGISRDTLSVAAHGVVAFQPVRQRGLLLDEWTEEIPVDTADTGIAFRYNQPDAAPPQALLLAVTPEETGAWQWNALVGTLTDTLARARRRAVEPAQLEREGLVWNALAPATVSEFSTLASADVSLDLMASLKFAKLESFYEGVAASAALGKLKSGG